MISSPDLFMTPHALPAALRCPHGPSAISPHAQALPTHYPPCRARHRQSLLLQEQRPARFVSQARTNLRNARQRSISVSNPDHETSVLMLSLPRVLVLLKKQSTSEYDIFPKIHCLTDRASRYSRVERLRFQGACVYLTL